MFRFLSTAFLVLIPSFAQAGGSVSLVEVMPLVGQSPRLVGELRTVLRNTNQKIEDIICDGVRLGPQFGPFSAERIAPFKCQFGSDTSLFLEANTLLLLSDGSEFDPAGSDAAAASNGYVLPKLKSWKWK